MLNAASGKVMLAMLDQKVPGELPSTSLIKTWLTNELSHHNSWIRKQLEGIQGSSAEAGHKARAPAWDEAFMPYFIKCPIKEGKEVVIKPK